MAHAASRPIALDAMGGDSGVLPLVRGAVDAVLQDRNPIILVGTDEVQKILEQLSSSTPGLAAARERGDLSFRLATDVVGMEDKPSWVLRHKKQSSMRLACDLVRDGGAVGVMSVANSGAMLATALLVLGRLDGVSRPAIATIMPSFSPCGRTVLVDAGANTECEPLHLAQWGLLGSIYLEHAFSQASPAVGVLSNGEEDTKGTELVREALALLRQTSLNVVGFCEGRDLNGGDVHVVVTDGFTGNVVLKTAEGVFSFMTKVIKQTFEQGNVVDQLGGLLSKPGWGRIREHLDPREFGAAPLLGLKQPAFIAHGKSDAHAVRCGLRAVRRFVDVDVCGHLGSALASAPSTLLRVRSEGAQDAHGGEVVVDLGSSPTGNPSDAGS